MRLPVVLLLCALAAILGGGALIGLPALGGCLIFEGVCAAVFALAWDDGKNMPTVREVGQTLESILERARAS